MQYPKTTSESGKCSQLQKIFAYGPRNLSESELLAIILNGGMNNGENLNSAMETALTMIQNFGVRGIINNFNTSHNIAENNELPPMQTAALAALSELFRRVHQKDRAEINCAEDAFEYFTELQKAQKELVQVVCLNSENIAFYSDSVSIGSENNTNCPLISIFNPPIRLYSKRILVAHNHPRGTAKPSAQDLEWHKKLIETARNLSIEVMDHIIVGEKEFFSFASEGLV